MAGGCKFGGGEMRGKPHTSTTAELQAAGECRPLPGSEDSGFNFPEIPNSCALKGGFSPFSSPVRTHFLCSFHSGANRAGDLGSRPTAPPSVGTLEHGVAGPPRLWSRGWFCISGIPAPAPMAACHRRPSPRSAGPSRGHPLLPAPLRKGEMELGLCGVFPRLCQPRNSEVVPKISLRALEQAGTCCHPAWGHQLSHRRSHWDGAGGFAHPTPKNRGRIRTKTPRRAPTGAQNLVIKQIKAGAWLCPCRAGTPGAPQRVNPAESGLRAWCPALRAQFCPYTGQGTHLPGPGGCRR